MKILIPIDASECSKNAAFWATGKPALFGKDPEIHIFYAQEPASDRIRFATDPDTLDEFYREEAKTVFDSIIDRCGTLPASHCFRRRQAFGRHGRDGHARQGPA